MHMYSIIIIVSINSSTLVIYIYIYEKGHFINGKASLNVPVQYSLCRGLDKSSGLF